MHRNNDNNSPGKTWLAANQVRNRYGDISGMTLWRWLHDERLGFPKPRYINKRRYWDEAELDAFDEAQASGSEVAA